MPEEITITPVEEMIVTPVVTPVPDKKLSFRPEDFAADIAKLAAEQGVPLSVPQTDAQTIVPPTPPAQPETPAAVTNEATKPVVVPEKFQTPTGEIDVAKVAKSTIDAEAALAKYLEKEKELKRKINEVKAQANPYINPPAAIAPKPEIPVNVPFAQKIREDIEAQGLETVLVKLFTAAEESAFERAQAKITNLEQVNADNSTKSQLEAIGKKDPWVYTPEGMETLINILNAQPYMWDAAEPYKAAYIHHQGNKVVSQSSPQVLTPTPTARVSAPVPTTQAASQTRISPEAIFDKLTDDQKLEFINKRPVNEREKWFIRAGFPAFNSR